MRISALQSLAPSSILLLLLPACALGFKLHHKTEMDLRPQPSIEQRPVSHLGTWHRPRRSTRRRHQRLVQSPSETTTIFTERLGSDSWSKILGNPCRAEPTPRAFAEEEVLDVQGRETEIKAWATGTIRALRVLKTDMVSWYIIHFRL